MGIKGLKNLINNYYPDTLRNNKIYSFSNKKVSIDTSLMLHRALHNTKYDTVSNIYKYFINIINNLYKEKIDIVFVFDGKPPDEKNNLLEKRRNKREKANQKVKTLSKLREQIENEEDFEDIMLKLSNSFNEDKIKEDEENEPNDSNLEDSFNSYHDFDESEYQYITSVLSDSITSCSSIDSLEETLNHNIDKEKKKGVSIKEKYINHLKKLFDLLKVKYIHIPEEADIVCKFLVSQGIVDACISDDMDLIAYGCPLIIQNYNFNSNNIEIIDMDKLLENLNLDYSQLLDLCICCGTDYNNKLINVKCKDIYNLIHKYNNIENIIENIENINIDAENEWNLNIENNNNKEFKTIKIPYQFDYSKTRSIFKKNLNLLDKYIKHYNVVKYNNVNMYDLINENNIKQFDDIIEFLNNNIIDWSESVIRSKISKILYNDYNKELYFTYKYNKLDKEDNKVDNIVDKEDTRIDEGNNIRKFNNNNNDKFNNKFSKFNNNIISKKKKKKKNKNKYIDSEIVSIESENLIPYNIYEQLTIQS